MHVAIVVIEQCWSLQHGHGHPVAKVTHMAVVVIEECQSLQDGHGYPVRRPEPTTACNSTEDYC